MNTWLKEMPRRIWTRLERTTLSEQALFTAVLAVAVGVSLWLLLTSVATYQIATSLARSANTAQGHDLFSALVRTCPRMLPGPDTANPWDGELDRYLPPCLEKYVRENEEVRCVAAGGGAASKPFLGVEHSDLFVEVGEAVSPRALALDPQLRARPFVYEGRGVMIMPPEITPQSPYRQTHVIEYVPTRTQALQRQGVMTMIAGGLAAVVTLGGVALIRLLLRQRESAQRRAREHEKLAVLGRMSAVMAHELRNPLAAAKGRSELMVELLEPGSKLQGRAQTVVDEIMRVQVVTERLLDFVRSGEVHRKLSDLVSVACDALERVGGAVTLEIDGEIPLWSFDPYAMERVLVNLLRNALQAQEGSGEPVALKVGLDNGQLHLSVIDHGPGFPTGIDLGAPFVTTRAEGTGLGLAVCRQIVHAHGGRIELGSTPSGGAQVQVWLPAPD